MKATRVHLDKQMTLVLCVVQALKKRPTVNAKILMSVPLTMAVVQTRRVVKITRAPPQLVPAMKDMKEMVKPAQISTNVL